MNKKAPVFRLSIVSRNKVNKEDLFRIYKSNSGEVKVDIDYKSGGRGAYLEKDLKAITIAHDKKLLNKALKCDVSEEIYLELISLLAKKRG